MQWYGSLHWSLIVICHFGEVASYKGKFFTTWTLPRKRVSTYWYISFFFFFFRCHISDGDGDSGRVPCILHMDSLRGTHSGLKDLIQRYFVTMINMKMCGGEYVCPYAYVSHAV